MILYFADRAFQILGMGSTDGGGLDIVNDMKTQEIGTGGMNFSCTIPFEKGGQKEAESLAAPGNYILRQSGDDREFYTIIESEVDTGSGEAYIYAEEAGLDLLNEIALPYEADREYPISHYIQRFANDSGFEIGINEIPDLQRKLKWENEGTATSRILSTAEQFGNVEISFSFEVKELSVIKKYINIYQKRGKDTGIQLRLGREVDRIVTKKSIANLATALYVTGDTPDGADNPITLEGISYDDGRFFLQGPWLKDKEANKKWSRYLAATETGEGTGYIMGTFSYETLDKEELLRAAIDRLEELSQVELNYEVDIAMLPEHVEIGDTVNIVDDEGELYLSARILKLEISIADDTAKATLGDYLIKDSGISQKIEELAAQFQNVAKSRTLYTWIAYADDAVGSGISVNPQGKTYMGTAANQISDVIDVSDPSIYTWVKIKGEDGEKGSDGLGIESTVVNYQVSNSGTQTPSGTWISNPPSLSPGQYLWTRTVITYSNGTKTTSYSIGKAGTNGTDGADGMDGKGIRNTEVSYKSSSSGTTIPTGTWYSYIPSVSAGSYLWTRTVITYTDNTSSTSYSVARMGSNGAVGAKGDSGIIVSSTAPSGPTVGQLWQTASGQPIKRWTGSSWVLHYISVDNLDVTHLSAISADLGTVNAGIIKNRAETVEFDIENGHITNFANGDRRFFAKISQGEIKVSDEKTNNNITITGNGLNFFHYGAIYEVLVRFEGNDMTIDNFPIVSSIKEKGTVIKQGTSVVNNTTASNYLKIVQLSYSEFSSSARYVVIASNGDHSVSSAPVAGAWVRASDRWVLGWSPTPISGYYRINYQVIKLPV